MGNRLSKIITRTGDDGTTALADGGRRSKADPRIVSIGDIDELNALLGWVIQQTGSNEVNDSLLKVQHDLFDLGAELSQPGKMLLDEDYLAYIDQRCDRFSAQLPPLREFVLPGGSAAVATVHVARTVCRRAERSLVALAQLETCNPVSLSYLNRLSDLLFIISRSIARQTGEQEILWQSEYSRIKPS